MGAVDPPIAAGVSVEPTPLRNVSEPVTMTINNKPAPVDFAGLVPYLTGLYQINYRLPFDEVVGDVPIRVYRRPGIVADEYFCTGGAQRLFYWVYTGGKFVNGQTLNGIAGANCAIAYWHNDKDVLGQSGYLAWAKEVAFGADGTATSGLALTLRDGDSIVYENNGIETGSYAGYYDGSAGTAGKPGMTVFPLYVEECERSHGWIFPAGRAHDDHAGDRLLRWQRRFGVAFRSGQPLQPVAHEHLVQRGRECAEQSQTVHGETSSRAIRKRASFRSPTPARSALLSRRH